MKSYLRKKWEALFLNLSMERIPNSYKKDNKYLIIENDEILDEIIHSKKIEDFKNTEYILVTQPLNNFENLIFFFNKIDKSFKNDLKLIVNYYSVLWKPVFFIFSIFGLIKNFNKALFFSQKTLDIFLKSTNFEISKNLQNNLIPVKIPFITKFFLLIINIFPFLSILSITKIFCLRKKKLFDNNLAQDMSLIIPCKNEEGNIKNIVERVKKDISFPYEIIFIDDKSDDNTLNLMNEEKNKNSELKIKIVNGPGKGKSAAIKAGIEKSDCLYSIIVDADMTVSIKDINLFYNAIKMSYGDLINGSRLIYKPYAGSMKTLNYFGNIFFGVLSSYISSHLITDTLCGSKCFKTKNFKIMEEYKIENNISDIWGDFNILFSCNYYGLKSVDLPVRYYEREAGETKMVKRFYFFLNMLKTCYKSFQKFKIKSFKKI